MKENEIPRTNKDILKCDISVNVVKLFIYFPPWRDLQSKCQVARQDLLMFRVRPDVMQAEGLMNR